MTRARLLLAGAIVLVLLGLGLALGRGAFGEHEGAGVIAGARLPSAAIAARAREQRAALEALEAAEAAHDALSGSAAAPSAVDCIRSATAPASSTCADASSTKAILFGDLHVHTSVSVDAFLMSLPLAGGEGAHPAADACDFARYCSALDFWSLNDHAENITPQLWRESVDAIRQCNAIAGDPDNPDTVAYLGWEWTQAGATPEQHWGHRNVILRDLADDAIPARPIAAMQNAATQSRVGDIARLSVPGRAALVAGRVGDARAHNFALALTELQDALRCPEGVPTRDLPRDCMESAATPGELFGKLREWGSAALVIPHGSASGSTASPLASWETQLGADANDPNLQPLIELYSGHGNSEEYRAWRPLARGADGALECPPPSPKYTPLCWRAGEIIERRCLARGQDAADCSERATEARREYANGSADAAERGAAASVVPLASGDDWGDAGQCRDCFLPAFQLRPLLSAQYALALTSFANPDKPWRYRFGFIASSDVHSARPGTGGLVAVHASSRSRGAVWDALARREVYGTSGQRTLLWFDLVNAPDGSARPMGSDVQLSFAPSFRVRAIGSQKQMPGCPDYAGSGLPADRLERLCRGECHNPSEERQRITRVEVVRIRPQQVAGEPIDGLIEDPWKTFACRPDAAGCVVEFADDEFAVRARDAVYYVRAIEATPSGPDGDRSSDIEERAWSSPIFVDYAGATAAASAGAPGALAPNTAGASDEVPPPVPPGQLDPAWSEVEHEAGDTF